MASTRVDRVKAVGTAEQILDVAERLVQTRGFNGFSFADIAGELEGAILLARLNNDPELFEAAARRLLAGLKPAIPHRTANVQREAMIRFDRGDELMT